MLANYKIVLSGLIVIIVFTGISFIALNYKNNRNNQKFTIEQAKTEIEFAQNSEKAVLDNKFISNLPIKTTEYKVFYSSVDKEIVVAFNDHFSTIEEAKKVLGNEILTKLKNIGVDIGKTKISWQIEQ